MKSSPSTSTAVAGPEIRQHTVPLVHGSLTFENVQDVQLKEMEKRLRKEYLRTERDWKHHIDRMRESLLELHPADQLENGGMLVEKLRSKDMYIKCPRGNTAKSSLSPAETISRVDGADNDVTTTRKFQLRFNTSSYDAASLKVTSDSDKISVEAVRSDDDGRGITAERKFYRRIQKPRDVDEKSVKAYSTSDGILLIEAAVTAHAHRANGNGNNPDAIAAATQDNNNTGKMANSASLSLSQKSKNSNCAGESPGTPSSSGSSSTGKDLKVGVPIFRDDNGIRRMYLTIELGTVFEPEDVTVQVLKEDKIQILAKHCVKTSERLSKTKFCKDYDLGERIETYSLKGGLTKDGKLLVGALAKGQTEEQTS